MVKKLLKILFYTFIVMVLACAALITAVYIQVSREASTRLDRGVIDRIISSESPVYYDDGKTPIGVYFEKTHRKYIKYKDIPKNYIKAIIASEDGNFFRHPGFDFKSTLRAFIANIKAGKIVQGGSTITQQTAKNIFKREKRTYLAKLKELIQALLLERRYSKEDILEMYVNQFFVTGFGKGVAIAAEYFFDKDVRDLDLVESAFLAGMVKGPNKYNPFVKKTEEERRKAERFAKIRKDYVLQNMRNLNLITEQQYLKARNREVPFKEGKITYGLNVILDYIREQLESDYFRNILHEQGVDNIATSGIKIYTSIDKEIQQGALKSVRKYLPMLDVKLSGYQTGLFQERYSQHIGTINRKPAADLPFFCTILDVHRDMKNPYLKVAWEDGEGIIEYQGFKQIGEAWLKWKLGNWAEFDNRHIPDFFKNFHEGDLIPVQFTDDNGGKEKKLELVEIPELEGGVIVLKKGMIKAMVGGFFDRYFNRAADAKRQLGSIFKPIVYTAALQLNWNSLDPLINRPDLFQFENTYYVPSPDHKPESDRVSMMWAGAKSENLATVWLLYHLTDRLNMSEFRQVVERLGLERHKSESYRDYVERIRDKYGIVVNGRAIMEAAFESGRKDIESDLIFSDREDVLDNLYRLHFDIDDNRLDLKKEKDFRISLFDFSRLRSLNFNMKRRFNEIQHLIEIYKEKFDPKIEGKIRSSLRYFYYGSHENSGIRITYSEDPDIANHEDLERLPLEMIMTRSGELSSGDIRIDDLIPSEVLDMLQSSMNRRYNEFLSHKRYDLEVLSKIRDFRILVNLMYTRELARELGITTPLDPVLSFPLGSNSISILEAALAYQTMVDGRRYYITPDLPNMVPIITRIVDREDNILWQYEPRSKKVLTGRITDSVSEILRMVMENGTGRNARNAIRLSMEFENGKYDVSIPSFGKTGTANRYTNSSFVGIIPSLNKETGDFDIKDSYVIASYVGYDDNRPMKGKYITIYGSSGALPIWIDTTNIIANCPEYRKGIQTHNIAFDEQKGFSVNDRNFRRVMISSVTGLPLQGNEETVFEDDAKEVYGNMEIKGRTSILKRKFEPLGGANNVKIN